MCGMLLNGTSDEPQVSSARSPGPAGWIANDVQRVLLAVTRTAYAFAVNGDYALDTPGYATEPLVAGLLQRFGVDQPEHPREGVV